MSLKNAQTVKIKGSVAAFLSEQQDEKGVTIAKRKLSEQPYWHVERARVAHTQKVKVELIVNGKPVDAAEIIADGNVKDINFSYQMQRSGWVALRVYPSSHSNPVFVSVSGKPIQELQSAEWCRKAVDQCWKMKQSKILPADQAAAAMGYDKARMVYDKIIKASK